MIRNNYVKATSTIHCLFCLLKDTIYYKKTKDTEYDSEKSMDIVRFCFTHGIKLRRQPPIYTGATRIKKAKYILAKMKMRRKLRSSLLVVK